MDPIINPNPAAGIKQEDLMSEIQTKLLNQSGAISSSSTKIEDAITGAITKLEESNVSGKKATESAFNREISFAEEAAMREQTAYREAQTGYATNVAALRDLRTANEKSINDLKQRREEALLASDSATASKVADLMLQKYQFEQQAQQQVFSNLVSLGNLTLQRAQEARLTEANKFTEQQAISNIALKYGLEVKPGETFADVVNKAKPFASEMQKMELDQMKAQLELTKANTQSALASARAAGAKIEKTPNFTQDDMTVFITGLKNGGRNADEIKSEILKLDITPEQRQQAYSLVDSLLTQQTRTPSASMFSLSPGTFKSPALNFGAATGEVLAKPGKAILDWIFGTK